MRDKRLFDRLHRLAAKARAARSPLEQAKVAAKLRDAADKVFVRCLLEANRNGIAWREIGAAVGVPYQTLHRRYGRRE